jgi:ABC-type dipeptide/oligopeptide/nickel transport system permease component
MTTYIIRRLIHAVIVLFLVTIIVFLVMRLLPGDPLIIYVAQTAELEAMPPEMLDELRKEFGLDKPIMVQYVNWILGICRGDFYTSIFYREKVGKLLLERSPVTIHLGVFSFIIGAFFIEPLDPLDLLIHWAPRPRLQGGACAALAGQSSTLVIPGKREQRTLIERKSV